jgi:hypothetical protein
MLAAAAGAKAPQAFLCAGTACAMPVQSPDKLADVIKRFAIDASSKTALANDPADALLKTQRSAAITTSP